MKAKRERRRSGEADNQQEKKEENTVCTKRKVKDQERTNERSQ